MKETTTKTTSQQVKPRYQSAIVVGLVVLAVGLSAACAQYKASTLLVTIAPRFSLSADGSAWIMSIFTLVGIFFALPAGGLAQRFGFKRVMLASSCLIIIGSIIGMLSGTNGPVLIASRAIEGISLTFITTCGPIAIQKCVDPKKTALATGIWGCWGNGGAVIASVLTPHIFGIAGFEGVWLAFAIVAALAALLLLFCIKSPESVCNEEQALPETGGDSAKGSRYRDLLTPNVVLFLVGFLAFNLIMLAILGMLPSVLQLPEKGFTLEQSGFATTLPSLISLASTPLVGAIAGKTGRVKQLLIITMSVLGPCVFVMYTQVGIAFWVAAVVLGVMGLACIGLLIAAWIEVIPNPSLVAKAMGVLTLVQCVGQFLGTFLIQILLGDGLSQWMTAGIALGIIGILGTLVMGFVKFK